MLIDKLYTGKKILILKAAISFQNSDPLNTFSSLDIEVSILFLNLSDY